MAVGAYRRLPDCTGFTDRRRRDRSNRVTLLIIDPDTGATLFYNNNASVSADRGRAPGYKLSCLLVVSIRRIVVVDKHKRLRSVRTLKDDVVAVRADSRSGVSETISRSGDRNRRVRLAVIEKDRPVGIVGHELSVGTHHRAEMVTRTRRNQGDGRRRYHKRNRRRRNRRNNYWRIYSGGGPRTRACRCGTAG